MANEDEKLVALLWSFPSLRSAFYLLLITTFSLFQCRLIKSLSLTSLRVIQDSHRCLNVLEFVPRSP